MKKILLLAFAILLIGSIAQAQVKCITVAGAGNGSGSGWANAISGLAFRAKLQAATYGTQFWVATGTYKPSLTNRDSAFVIPNGVKVFGGFRGTETTLEGRDTTNTNLKTILTGEIQGDTTVQNNSFNVVRFYFADGNTELNSVTVMKGCANGSQVFRSSGAGIFSENSSAFCNHVVIRDNLVTGGGGGGISAVNGNPRMNDCSFINDNSPGGGGGIAFFHGAPAAGVDRGAFDTGGNIIVTNSVFRADSSDFAGGAAEFGTSATGIFTNCLFEANIATAYGGGIFTEGDSLIVKNCRFKNNKTIGTAPWGGAVHVGSYASFDNVLFEGNEASTGGALAMFTNGLTTLRINNCTFVGNRSTGAGFKSGDHIHRENSDVVITNSIFDTVANGRGQFGQTAGNGTMTITSSLTTRALPSFIVNGGGNILANPRFVAPASGNYSLSTCSPAVNAGRNSLMLFPPSATDLAGNARRYLNDTVDLGAYEYQGAKGVPVAAFTSVVNQATKAGTFTYSGTLPADSVRWTFGDGATSTLLNPTHTYTGRTNYTVCVTTYMSCGSNQKCTQVALSAGGMAALGDVRVYPNPANSFIVIEGLPGAAYSICDMAGRSVAQGSLLTDKDRISIDYLVPGTYMLMLTDPRGVRGAVTIVKQQAML